MAFLILRRRNCRRDLLRQHASHRGWFFLWPLRTPFHLPERPDLQAHQDRQVAIVPPPNVWRHLASFDPHFAVAEMRAEGPYYVRSLPMAWLMPLLLGNCRSSRLLKKVDAANPCWTRTCGTRSALQLADFKEFSPLTWMTLPLRRLTTSSTSSTSSSPADLARSARKSPL